MDREPIIGDRVHVISAYAIHGTLKDAYIEGTVTSRVGRVLCIEYDDPGIEQLCFAEHGRDYSRLNIDDVEVLG